jgi:hypothetical protein
MAERSAHKDLPNEWRLLSDKSFEEQNSEILVLSKELKTKLSVVINRKEQDFDPITLINQKFPPGSEHKTQKYLEELQNEVHTIDTNLRALIQKKSKEQDNAKILSIIGQDIKELTARLDIARKMATSYETECLEVTKDIKQMDIASINIKNTMILLTKIEILEQGLVKLQAFTSTRDFIKIHQLLVILLKISNDLKEYSSLPTVLNLLNVFKKHQADLRKLIYTLFQESYHAHNLANDQILLNSACLVLEMLENDGKDYLIKWYIEIQMHEYKDLLRNNPEIGSLNELSKRYSWLKRILKIFDSEHSMAFPKHWIVDQHLSMAFCDQTRKDIKTLLSETETKDSFDTNSMIQAFHISKDFEEKLEHRFTTKTKPTTNLHFTGFIIGIFNEFLWHYVDSEDKSISKRFKQYEKNLYEKEQGIYTCSSELFIMFKQNFTEFAQITIGKPFYDLCKMYQKWLHKFNELLLGQVSQ